MTRKGTYDDVEAEDSAFWPHYDTRARPWEETEASLQRHSRTQLRHEKWLLWRLVQVDGPMVYSDYVLIIYR